MNNNIAIFGFGVVGKGTFEILKNIKSEYDFKVKYVFDKPNKKDILGDLLETDYEKIIHDPEINIVIECLGGDELPYKIITSALKNKKHVISSNKETIAKHFDEYLKLANENNVQFLFEAAVGGGIPIIKPLINISRFDRFICYKGILNGTSNYILTKLFSDDISLEEAIKEAQELGFAEQDPGFDINGNDLKHKGIILSSILFNKKINYDDVEIFGIKNINKDIVKKVKEMNKVIKLIVKGGDWNQLIVLPIIVPKTNLLASINNEFNGLIVECAKNDRLTFIGKGAGSEPTASAILQDLFSIIEGNFNIKRDNATQMNVKFMESGQFLTLKDNVIEIKEINTIEELHQYDFIAKISNN